MSSLATSLKNSSTRNAVLPPLRLTHFHIKVKDLQATLAWFHDVCDTGPNFHKGSMAYLTFGGVTLVLEEDHFDTEITIAFASENCDQDFATLLERGAYALATPDSKPWGIRGAYVKGPAGVTFELEQRLATGSL